MSNDRPPVTQFARDRVMAGKCPRCKCPLDCAWVCTHCRYDASWVAQAVKETRNDRR